MLATGNDKTDETMFSALPAETFSIRIGKCSSLAKYNVGSYVEFVALLNALSD